MIAATSRRGADFGDVALCGAAIFGWESRSKSATGTGVQPETGGIHNLDGLFLQSVSYWSFVHSVIGRRRTRASPDSDLALGPESPGSDEQIDRNRPRAREHHEGQRQRVATGRGGRVGGQLAGAAARGDRLAQFDGSS